MTRRLRIALAGSAVIGALAAAAAPGVGLFSAETTTSGTFSAAADWTGPTATPVIQKSGGGSPGFLMAGGSFRVYANIADSGNPASGVASASANVSAIAAGQTAAGLSATGGPFAVFGTSYAYRSGVLSADPSAVPGSKDYAIASADAAGNAGLQGGFAVTIDNTPPAGVDIQTANGAGLTAARPEAGDSITYTFSEPIDPQSVLAGWDGGATDVVARIDEVLLGEDRLSVRNAANTTTLPLSLADSSHVTLGSGLYVSTTVNFGATGTASRMVMSGATITVTLGTPSATTGTGLPGSMTWATSTVATDRAGNPVALATVNETGASDAEF